MEPSSSAVSPKQPDSQEPLRVHSLSKTVNGYAENGEQVSLNKLWNRRQCHKIQWHIILVQRAAEATYSIEGKKQVKR